MINIDEIYENTVSMAQKAKHGAIRVVDFNRYANLANTDLFNERIGTVRDYYKLGKAIPTVTPSMTKQVEHLLRPFFVPNYVTPVVAGMADLPVGLEFVDSISYDGVAVKWVPKNKEDNYLNSSIDFPTEEYPIYIDEANDVRIHPSSITQVEVSYYKSPVVVKWNYTLVNGRPVYSASGSVNFEWDSSQKLELITRILGYIGITIKDMNLIQYAGNEENTIA